MNLLAILSGFIAANGGPIAVAVIAAQALSRAIPPSVGGFLGTVRRVTAIVGMYAPTQTKINTDALASQGLVAPRDQSQFSLPLTSTRR